MSIHHYDVPEVHRVPTAHGSRIEPPLAEGRSNLEALRWQAAVIELDAGLEPGCIRVFESEYTIGGVRQRDYYNISTKHSSIAPCGFESAWSLLNGIAMGVRLGRAVEVSS